MGYFEERWEKQSLEINNYPIKAPFPKNALIEISNGCNHKCLFCYNTLMQRRVGKISKDIFIKFLKNAVNLQLEEIGLYTTGEPFINRDLHEFIKIAKDIGIKRIYVTSNGALANVEYVEECIKAGLSSIKFSINAADKISYKIIHGKDDWDKVLLNIKDIHNLKLSKYPHFKLLGSCIMTTVTGDIREKYHSIFGKYLEDVFISFAGSQGGRNGEHVERFSPGISLQRNNIDSKLEPCDMLWNRFHLTCEGYLTLCCVDYEHDLIYANFNEENLEEAWNNEIIKEMRVKHVENKMEGTICYNCLSGCKTKYEPISNISNLNNPQKNLENKKLDSYLKRIETVEKMENKLI